MGGLELKTAGTHQIKDTILRQTSPEDNKKCHQGASKAQYQGSAIDDLVSQRCDKMEMNDILSIDKNETQTAHVTSEIQNIG